MRKTFKALSLIFAIIMIVTSLPIASFAEGIGTTYYVDSINGNDANDGTSPEKAWKTLSRASSVTYSPGDEILLKKGSIFFERFGARGNGTEENPITLATYGEGKMPILTNSPNDSQYAPVVSVTDVSHWVIKDIEITAPNGTGILIYFNNKIVEDITIDSVVLHDIQNYASDNYYSSQRAAIRMFGNTGKPYNYLSDIHINNCEIYNCGYGIFAGGHYNEENPNSEMYPYNKDILVENCSIYDLYDDGFILAQAERITLRNTSIINTCLSSGIYATAPTWTWGVTDALIENCEIAGAKNIKDGMACDFDDHTDNSTYQYIYSHDNVRFMWNCVYEEDHFNNTVRYCLSVNDNITTNAGSWEGLPEIGFKFYNNTIVNGSDYCFRRYKDSYICNNIFSLLPGHRVILNNEYDNTFSNNCYYGALPTRIDENSFWADPQFAGTDLTDKNSFMLKKCSPCINAGIQVEEDMGEHDFYGNPLDDTHNIGCYEGDGIDLPETPFNIFITIRRVFEGIFRYILSAFE